MTCSNCNGKTHIYDTIPYKEYVFRRHVCTVCGSRFDTKEELLKDVDYLTFRDGINYKEKCKRLRRAQKQFN